MELVLLALCGLTWGAVCHGSLRGDYWLLSLAAAAVAAALFLTLVQPSDSPSFHSLEWIITWVCVVVFVLPAVCLAGLPFLLMRIRRRPSNTCRKCGYFLYGLPLPRCPECGLAFDPKGDPLGAPAGSFAALGLQFVFAVSFFGAGALMIATLAFAGWEKLTDRDSLWLWAVLGLSCMAIPCVGRARGRWNLAAWTVIAGLAVAILIVWWHVVS